MLNCTLGEPSLKFVKTQKCGQLHNMCGSVTNTSEPVKLMTVLTRPAGWGRRSGRSANFAPASSLIQTSLCKHHIAS